MMPASAGSPDHAGTLSLPFRHVLVGWDGSPGSAAALRMAADIVGDGPGHVVALAILPQPVEARPGQAGGEAAGTHWVQEEFTRARASIAATSPARIDLRTHPGDGRHAAQSVCAYATEHGFDLLVLGRHGDGGLLHPKLGHVAKAAATASTLPVLLVSSH